MGWLGVQSLKLEGGAKRGIDRRYDAIETCVG
jgi:hypothetical protein